jgi:hypothetical protein
MFLVILIRESGRIGRLRLSVRGCWYPWVPEFKSGWWSAYPERSLVPIVSRRSFVRRGDASVVESDVGELLRDSLVLAEEDRCLFSESARMSSRLTLRSEDIGATDVSSSSVNLEAVMVESKF